jgi:carbonic anhydrase
MKYILIFIAAWGSSLYASPSTDELTELKNGNTRFMTGKAIHPDQSPQARQKLTEAQSPSAIVLSCSDSRVPPELIFDEGLGKLFTVRVAGNIIDAATVASIEYAVSHFNASLIVVLGHDSCGAVKAALETPSGTSAGSKDLDTLVTSVRANLGGKYTLSALDKTLHPAVVANVKAVTRDLMSRSKIIRSQVEAGKLAIVPAVYALSSGEVEFFANTPLTPK